MAALLAAVEIYNKPQIEYRNECFSILLVNAWELLLKAILSKNKQRIFYPKKRNEPYRTFSIQDALLKAQRFFPPDIPYEPVARNIDMLVTYRNNAIHFYNQRGFGVVIYGLAQTSIINYRDLLLAVFGIDVANKMTISLLPLSFGSQPDPIAFLQQVKSNPPRSKAVTQFLGELSTITTDLETRGIDTSRFLTVFSISLKSVKKVSSADVVADVVADVMGSSGDGDTLVVQRRIDPNITHPLRQKEILEKVGPELAGIKFTSYTFQAIVRKYDIKNKPHLCWRSSKGELTRYSAGLPAFLRRLSEKAIIDALDSYRDYQRKRRQQKRKAT